MRIKTYKLFLEKRGPYDEDLEFEFIANVGKMKTAIVKVVEVHEKHYYNDTKISNNSGFKQSINDLIDLSMNKGDIFTEDYLLVIKMFENRLYGKNLFKLNDKYRDESRFGILDKVISHFNNLVRNKKRDSDDIKRFREDIDHVMSIKDEWIYQKKMNNQFDINDIELKLEDGDGIWKSEEEFEKDMSDYIGKPMDDFDYSDKLQAYKYIENKPWVKSVLSSTNKDDKEYIEGFLKKLKNNFGL